jgi:hypothetical protein
MFTPSPKMSSPSVIVAEIDPDAELDPLLRRDAGVPLGHATLYLRGAPHRINDARKFRQ